ncbi:MAG: hypothetical protein GDA50_07990 [Alphaproteobacteria bacterium GM202ARS2]|nr:hypothetical protein [Alphaproteobacteria bacterium GM202ARS2]
MPTSINQTQTFLKPSFLASLPKNSRLLVSTNNQLVEKREVPRGFFGRLFGRKTRVIYLTVESTARRPQRIAAKHVLSPQASRDQLAQSFLSHLTSTFQETTAANTGQATHAHKELAERFVKNASIHINQKIRGNKTGDETVPYNADPLQSQTFKSMLESLGKNMKRLSEELNNAQQQKTNQFNKKAFVYNNTLELKNLHATDQASLPQACYKKARQIRASALDNVLKATSKSNTQNFKKELKGMVASFYNQNTIDSNHPSAQRLMKVVDDFLPDDAKPKPFTKQELTTTLHRLSDEDLYGSQTDNQKGLEQVERIKTHLNNRKRLEFARDRLKHMDSLLKNLPETLADLAYETKHNPDGVKATKNIDVVIGRSFPKWWQRQQATNA